MEAFEFVIAGPPVSQQSNNRALLQAWKLRVRQSAVTRWPEGVPPVATATQITIVYFQRPEGFKIDNDNFAKPIADALIGLVYEDDYMVTDTKIRRTLLNGRLNIRSRALAEGVGLGVQFMYVKVEDAPDHEERP